MEWLHLSNYSAGSAAGTLRRNWPAAVGAAEGSLLFKQRWKRCTSKSAQFEFYSVKGWKNALFPELFLGNHEFLK